MVFDIRNLHAKGREWKVVNGRSRDLLQMDGIGRGGKQEGTGRKKMHTTKASFRGVRRRPTAVQMPMLRGNRVWLFRLQKYQTR